MVTISIYGLDQYVVGRYSKEHTANLAQLFEVSEEDVVFYSPNAYVFQNGVEQTSWNAIVKVNAPEQCENLEEKVQKYLIQTLKEFSINVIVEFYYYHKHHRYEYINHEYPRFIKDDNVVNCEPDDYEDGDELCEENMFKDFEEKLADAATCKCGHKH